MDFVRQPLYLNPQDFRFLLEKLGPSLGFWRAAEIAVLREQPFDPPVLDLGCGDGLLMSMVLPEVEVGLDPDTDALERARQRGLYRRVEAAPMEQSQVPDGSISTIVSNSVLEHVTRIDAALQTAARKLRPGGRLIFTVPSDSFSRWLVLPNAGYAARRNQHYEHLNLWPVETWAARLNDAGLEIETVRSYLRQNYVTAWDALELMQRVHIGKKRAFGMVWRKLPASLLALMAERASRIDLSSEEPGGGRLIVARKVK